VWSVQDPYGIAFRLDFLATFNSQVWQIKPVFQMKPPNITSLNQTIYPIPDDLSYLVKQGFLAYCYKQVDHAKFLVEYQQWQQKIQLAMGASDRENQEFGFYPSEPLAGSGTSSGSYPGWLGWSNDGY